MNNKSKTGIRRRLFQPWLLAWAFVPFVAFAQGNLELQNTNGPTFFFGVTNVYTNIFVNPTNGITNAVVVTNVNSWPAFLSTNIVVTNGVTNAIITTNIFWGMTNMPTTPFFPPAKPKPWWKRWWERFFG